METGRQLDKPPCHWGVQPPGTLAPLMQRQTSSDQLKPSLHSMTCARCNHGFCWRCLKSWKPSHKDYYNCSAMVRGWACQRPSQPRQPESCPQNSGGAVRTKGQQG